VETHWLQPNPPTRVGGSNIHQHAGSSQPSEPQETNSLQPNPPTRVGGTSNINAGESAITLTDSDNDFLDTVSLTGNTAQITDKNDLTLGTLAIGQDLTVNSTGMLNLGQGSVGGTLTANGNNITQDGSLSITGTSSINAGAGNITLANGSNNFTGTVSLTGGTVQITGTNELTLGILAVTGNLTATSTGALNLGEGSVGGTLTANSNGGNITQAGSLSITGTSAINASAGNITLTDSNNFTGAVTLTGGVTQVTDANALTVILATTGDATLIAGGNLTASGSVSGAGGLLTTTTTNGGTTTFGATTVAVNLSVTSAGAVSQTGALTVGGTSSINAGAGNITLANGSNNFTGTVSLTGGTVQITDINDLVMASGNISGTLGVTAGNSITGTSPLVVAGSATFESFGSDDVSLTGANDFSSVGITNAGDVTINDINSLILAASTLAGDLDVTAFGAITDSGAISAQGKAAFNSTGIGEINLDQLNVIGLITADTIVGDATLVNAVATSFGGSVGGLFSVRAITGGVTDGGPVITTNGLVLQAPGTSQISQALTGTGGLTFNGTGTLTVAGTNTYTGDTVITSGVLTLTGSLATSHVRAQGGTLRGNGNLGNLSSSSGGTVRPGNSPGSFTSSGPISIGASSTYTVEINGLNPVSGYSQLVAPGATLGGILTLTTANPDFNPQIGTRFTIIDNSGPNKVSGTFAGLPERGVVFNGNQAYTITYKGGTGNNDVQLIRTHVIPTPTGPVVTQPFNPNPGVTASATNGTPAQVQLSTVSGGFNGGVTRRIVPFRGYTGMISVNALDRTGDGVADSLLVSKATPGNLSTVMVIDAATGRVAMQFNAFGNKFLGGARVSSGLTTINGVARTVITVAAGPGSAPTVKVYDAITGSLVKSFNAFGTNYRSGLDIAMTSQTATQPGVLTVVSLVNSFVRVFDLNNTAAPLASFQAFTQQPMPATSIAVGDVNGDGNREIIVGIGNLNRPAVRVFSMTGQRLSQFTPYPLEYTGGVTMGVNDYDRDGVLDIVTVAQSVARGRVRIFRATGSPVLGNFRLASVLTVATAGSNGAIED